MASHNPAGLLAECQHVLRAVGAPHLVQLHPLQLAYLGGN
jgi:hypothetical protein